MMDNKYLIYHWMEQGSEMWHDIRLGRIGGSTASALLMKYTTVGYNDLIANNAVEILTGTSEPTFNSQDMQNGIDREPDARDLYADIMGFDVKECGFIERTGEMWSDYAGISPDGLIGDNGMTQIKCPKAKTMFNYYGLKDAPKPYIPQMQFELFITGREWNDFVAYYPGLKPKIIRVYPDPKMFERFETELVVAVEKIQGLIKEYRSLDYDYPETGSGSAETPQD